jgi:DNA-binding IclR family transcriptional regulator
VPASAEHSDVPSPGGGDGRSIQRVVAVLDFIAARAAGPAPGVVEVARGVGLEKSVASRHLRLLVEAGLLERDTNLGYRIGARLFSLASAAQDRRLIELGERAVAELASEFGERAELFVRTANAAMTVATASPDSPLQVISWVGRTHPLHNTAAGRALLFDATVGEVRSLLRSPVASGSGPHAPQDVDDVLDRLAVEGARGWCLAREETDRGLVAVAVPVRAARGQVIASLVVSGPLERLEPRTTEAAAVLTEHAGRISTALGAAARAASVAADPPCPPPQEVTV